MIDKRKMRIILFAVSIAVFAAISALYLEKEKCYCLGVEIKDRTEFISSHKYMRQDLCDEMLFKDYPAAVDTDTDTIYISQNMDGTTLYTELEGILTVTDEKYPLYFLEDKGFDDFPQAVKDGHRFELAVDTLDGNYMKYDVVFTNLPTIRITGEEMYRDDENRRVYSGDITVWDPEYEKTGKYLVQSSGLEWHRRGGSTLEDAKASWKLALKNEDGTNNDLEFIGLEKGDDDWILNAVHRDDTKVREKLAMDMWNKYCETADYNYKMSTGRYAEVVNNGQYCGLYLLQRRIDGKYLELEDQILLKSIKATDGLPIEFFYDIVYPYVEKTERDDPSQDNLSEEEKYIYNLIGPFHNKNYGNLIDIDNWMDINIMLDFGYMSDNAGSKNIFYLLENVSEDMKIKQILWDTDYSLGVGYNFTHQPESADTKRKYRREYDELLQKYPDLDIMLATRWFDMRESIFDADAIYSAIEEYCDEIVKCGAFQREKELWGCYYEGGTDTVEALYAYIGKRLEYLDSCYGSLLQ